MFVGKPLLSSQYETRVVDLSDTDEVKSPSAVFWTNTFQFRPNKVRHKRLLNSLQVAGGREFKTDDLRSRR